MFTDDLEWHRAMDEAELSATPSQLRGLFVGILTCANDNVDAGALWHAFRDSMAEDYAYRRRTSTNRVPTPIAIDHNAALLDIQEMLAQSGRSIADFVGLPGYDPSLPHPGDTRRRTWEERFLPTGEDEVAMLRELIDVSVQMLNTEQRAFYDEVSEGHEGQKIVPLRAPGHCHPIMVPS